MGGVGGMGGVFLSLYPKLSPVFLCFTLRNLRSVISFNWKNDQWNAAHLFCFYIKKTVFITSTFYPSKLAFCDLIQLKSDQWNAADLLCFYIQLRESDWGSPTRGARIKQFNQAKIHTYDTYI